MHQNQGQKPPSIASSLNRAFLQTQNTLILHSEGLEVLQALAQSLYFEKSHLTILIDFPPIQIQELNYYLQEIKQQRVILQDDIRSDKPQAVILNKFTREKRKKCYISGGIYSLTTQVMLLDCLSDTNDLNVGYINRVIICDGEYEAADKYGLIVWLATLVSLNKNKTIITLVSNRVKMFKGDQLEKIMRLMYMKKLVLWPFGRSEIHKALQVCSVANINHKLNLNSTQSSLHQHYMDLMRYCQKSPFDKQNIQYICHCLLNYSKLEYLYRLEQLVENSSEYSIWKSSNTNVIEIVDQIIRTSRNCVISLILCQLEKQVTEGVSQSQSLLEKQSKYRIVDLRTLIPQQSVTNPNPDEISKVNQNLIQTKNEKMAYKLLYELHVPGLEKIEAQNSDLYPVKLMEILKQVKTYYSQLCQDVSSKKLSPSQEELQIQAMICESLERSMRTKKQTQSEHQNQKSENFDQKTQKIEQTKIVSQQIKEKKNSFDFSSYSFDKKLLNPKKNQKQTQISQIKTIIEQKQHSQSQNIKSVSNQDKGYKQRVGIIQDIQIQQTVYISTNNKQIAKNLHFGIFCYEHNIHYIAYIHKLYKYLGRKADERVAAIRKIIKRINNPSIKSSAMLHIEQEPVLLQELYLQLKSVNQIVEKYIAIKDDQIQRNSLFNKEIQRLELRYVNKNEIRLTNRDYSSFDDCVLSIPAQINCKVRFCIQENSCISQLTQNLRILAPQQIFFYVPNTSFIRHLNIAYSQQLLVGTEKIHTIYFNNSMESDRVIKKVKEEDECFWGIGQERKKLGQYLENAEIRIKELIIDDDIQKKSKMMSLAAATQAKNSRNQAAYINMMDVVKVERLVLIDKRQFKSLLPSYLFHHGFKVIPLFLENADYILSNDIGIQKKSVHTRDLHESLKSGRLQEQIKRLCSKFAKPYLLIECPDISYFKKQQFASSYNRISGEKYTLNIRKQLIQILYKFPKINLIWSTSYMDTIKFFTQLKKNREEPDVNKFRPQGDENELQILEENQNTITVTSSQLT